jgi:hypothetical protein
MLDLELVLYQIVSVFQLATKKSAKSFLCHHTDNEAEKKRIVTCMWGENRLWDENNLRQVRMEEVEQ